MSYEDFVYFILAEEDKSSEASLEYCIASVICFFVRCLEYRQIGYHQSFVNIVNIK
ncbi:hypothetical protein KSP39_PZI010490 [Platanthera zijinensis]|uniref:Uncharacterized protein n=1 Tax=Platanthera zijinensis TaxID=2320716 RepID=A0AAP0G714_9ASPA